MPRPASDARVWVVLLVAIGLGAVGPGCSPDPDGSVVLVEVGDTAIDAATLGDYVIQLPEHLGSTLTGIERIRDLLQGLVDRQIMVMEARKLGYFEDVEVARRLHRAAADRLRERLVGAAISDAIEISPAAVSEAYRAEGWDRRVRVAHMEVEDETRAGEVVDLLDSGADFAALARAHSRARDANAGGDRGRYVAVAELPPALAAVIRELDVGAHSAPVRTGRGFEIVKVLAAVDVGLEDVREPLRRNLRQRATRDSLGQLLKRLERHFGIHYEGVAIAAVRELAPSGSGTALRHPDQALATRGGSVLLRAGDGARLLRNGVLGGGAIADSSSFVATLRESVLADSLLVWEARHRGLDRTPGFASFRRRRHEKLAVTELRRREVIEPITLSEEEIHRRYEADKDEFTDPPTAQLTEIRTDGRPLAEELRRRIEAGEDMVALARRHTIDASDRAAAAAGHLHVSEPVAGAPADGLAEIRDAIRGRQIGELIGPLELADGSIALLRIEGRFEARVRGLESVRPVLEYRLKREKNVAAFERYIQELRRRYDHRVVWHDAAIADLARRPGLVPGL